MSRPSEDSLSDEIELARQQGGESVGALLDRYRNYLYLMARTQIDLHLAVRASPSDVVQETFLQAANEFPSFRGSDSGQLLSWLRRILVHNIIAAYDRHVRAAKRDVRRDRPLEVVAKAVDASSLHFDQALARSTESPEAAAVRQEEATHIADLLAELPQHYREVIILRNLEGLSFQEVSQRMGRTNAAVRKLWTRAITRLQHPSEGGSANG